MKLWVGYGRFRQVADELRVALAALREEMSARDAAQAAALTDMGARIDALENGRAEDRRTHADAASALRDRTDRLGSKVEDVARDLADLAARPLPDDPAPALAEIARQVALMETRLRLHGEEQAAVAEALLDRIERLRRASA